MTPDDATAQGWVVAPDGGRPQGRSCSHREQAVPGTGLPGTEGCAECLARGGTWVHLRACLTCGHVGCCDSSRGQHAHAHHERSGHPLVRSVEPGETWAWCYEDEVFLRPGP
ncbi:UBP-type zinc finger domain-containing protein [Streptomyces sp. NPDC060011]|uniref:UBP-type zinc finger domain-containing protein n=2 Tax=Streptomyces TaxID=1883 RepID=UPI0013BA4275|nr:MULTISPECIES: UBP-type zinc finger domain-containing protein [unclassified Streptomyces]MCX5285155.1 UBP-type zinc finger domain-containing protein [Streptomyces sp. NBC_00198]NEB28839.1 UBP-type zinc finger domain-containing protein [Streptomyces sp. SID14446]WSD82556.1 UBP-type zinc finger domain-containing protein [Streptomyces sp. NBC_01558]